MKNRKDFLRISIQGNMCLTVVREEGRSGICHVTYTKNRIFLFLVKELDRGEVNRFLLLCPRFGFSACRTLHERSGPFRIEWKEASRPDD